MTEEHNEHLQTLQDIPLWMQKIESSSSIIRFFAESISKTIEKFEDSLMLMPQFFETVKACVPEEILAASLTDQQKKQLAKGILKFVRKTDSGEIIGSLYDAKTGQFVTNVPRKNIQFTPAMSQALSSLTMQAQLLEIASKIEDVQHSIEVIIEGQQNDRLATAFSCVQKFLQAQQIRNPDLKNTVLLRIALDAEDSRNRLMLTQKSNVEFLKNQPESFWGKLTSGAKTKDIDSRIDSIRNSLYVINAVSTVQSACYEALDEPYAAAQSMRYFGEYMKETFLDSDGLLSRLDQLDYSANHYWTKTIPPVCEQAMLLLEENEKGIDDDEKMYEMQERTSE